VTDSFWDGEATPAGVFNVADDYQRYTDRQATFIVDRIRADFADVILDLGCGIGRLTMAVADQYGGEVVGVDSSPVMIREATARRTGRVSFRLNDGETLPPVEGLSGMFSVLMFQHVDDMTAATYLGDVAWQLWRWSYTVSQWVTRGASGPLAYPRSRKRIRELHEDAGLTVVEVVNDRDVTGYVDEWVWVVAQKRL